MSRLRRARDRSAEAVRRVTAPLARWVRNLDPSERVMYPGLVMLTLGFAAILDWFHLPTFAALVAPGLVFVRLATRGVGRTDGGS